MIEQANSSPGLAYLDSLQGSGIRPGLARIRAVLRQLGHPERAYESILVAGTNGKGSTSAMLSSILVEAGYRTAHYTSPHLVDIRERWTIGRDMIDPLLLEQAIAEVRAAADAVGIVPTYFEALTIVAFAAFRLAGCEVAVLEVGMGGRLDATNVVKPLASVITPIGFDHTEFLGNTIAKIAAEKAGIIHRGALVLTSNEDPMVLRVLRRRCEKFGCELQVIEGEHDTPLAGDFQRRNAALAVATARALRPRLPGVTEQAIALGAKRTRWRGRLEHLRRRGKQIWIDGAHNAHAVAAVTPYLDRVVPRPRLLVFGIMSDKEVEKVASTLFPLFDRAITTEPFPPRSARAADLAALARRSGVEAIAAPRPRDAFERAMAAKEPSIVVAGSLYLAGAAIEFFDDLSE